MMVEMSWHHYMSGLSCVPPELYKTAQTYNDAMTSPPSSYNNPPPSSFAEKLRAGASSGTPWVRLAHNDRERINSTSSDISVEGAVPAPSYQKSFSASLNVAFANLGHEQQETTAVVKSPASGGKKK